MSSGGKKRLVIDLRYLNGCLLKDSFKYEDLRIAMLMFQKGDYLFSFDLKSSYHHVDIHKHHWQYLGFSWGEGDRLQYYEFKVLPFGLATACYMFTKLLRPLRKHWQGQGLRAIIYLADGIVAVNGEAAAKSASSQVRAELVMAGLIEHTANCIWTPTTQIGWLGFDLDLSKGVISVPKTKLDALYKQLEEATKGETIQARCLASIIGKIISMSLGLGPVARLQTRNMYAVLNSRQAWCQLLRISHEAKMKLRFWLGQLKYFNGQNIWHSPFAIRVVYSDASDTGHGGYVVEHSCHIAQGQWLPHEARLSSTWRELQVVLKVLQFLTSKLHNQRIHWFTDNQNVVRILSVGSKNPLLQQEAIAIFNNSIRNQVRIEPEWIPRETNQQVDFINRIVDSDDWILHPDLFEKLDTKWGPHTVDRFANCFNT